MPSAAVRDEGALQMRPAPCGYSSACVLRPHFLFSFRKGNGVARQRKRRPRKTGTANRAAIASEEASSIPFPPGRRKLHIRSLLLPSQIVTVSLGHNLAIWNFTTPHAILMMALRQHLRIRFVRAAYPIYAKKRRQMASLFCLHQTFSLILAALPRRSRR